MFETPISGVRIFSCCLRIQGAVMSAHKTVALRHGGQKVTLGVSQWLVEASRQ